MLPELIAEAQAIRRDAERDFGRLTAAQLNWKPAADAWSVAQCFEHLIKINSTYFPLFDRIAAGTYTPPFAARLPLLPRVMGRLVLGAVSPEGARKYKASGFVAPSTSAIGADVIDRFARHQDDVIAWMNRLTRTDLDTTIVVSPVGPAVYSMTDAFRIIVAHERRHMAQAQRVVDTPAFPKAQDRGTMMNG